MILTGLLYFEFAYDTSLIIFLNTIYAIDYIGDAGNKKCL